mmetsp:Transcript_46558/g.111983  ORF Transcript_46558/g.111983 Transcript_46558/m.111983 type:complete len:281 (-) Transcript_46558:23-865(-)
MSNVSLRTTSSRLLSTFTTRQAALARRTAVAISLARKKPNKPRPGQMQVKRRGVVAYSPLSSRISRAVVAQERDKEYDDQGMIDADSPLPAFQHAVGISEPLSAAAQARLLEEEELDFDDPAAALASKGTGELLRAHLVLQMCRVPPLVAYGRRLYSMSCALLGQSLTDRAVKATFFGHFCGGEDEGELSPVLARMKGLGVGSILDYAAENDVPEGKRQRGRSEGVVSARTFDYVNEKMCDSNAAMVVRALEAAARARGGGGGVVLFCFMRDGCCHVETT